LVQIAEPFFDFPAYFHFDHFPFKFYFLLEVVALLNLLCSKLEQLFHNHFFEHVFSYGVPGVLIIEAKVALNLLVALHQFGVQLLGPDCVAFYVKHHKEEGFHLQVDILLVRFLMAQEVGDCFEKEGGVQFLRYDLEEGEVGAVLVVVGTDGSLTQPLR